MQKSVKIVSKKITISRLMVAFFIMCFFAIQANDDYIIVYKKDVKHTFVPFDGPTDHFVKNIFAHWEKETFEVFDKVKDPNGIAIDLGAWIGTTAIWCSKNFSHVIAVDADRLSLQCLKNNLIASQCFNVTICPRPVVDTCKQFIFGPRGNSLNESISYVKDESNNVHDYCVQGITFKQLIYDFVYQNDALKDKKISFIKCDIEGGEENILEDLLYFAYHNKLKAYISFHASWWKSKKLADFAYLFKFFKTDCPIDDVVSYIEQNPFCSLLFEPLENAGTLIKKNIPVVIIGYNQFSYIKNMVSQLEKYTSDIIIVDNNSSYEPLLNYYDNNFKYTLLRQKSNYGHAVISDNFVQSLIGDVYVITDPDLQFNINLPENFLEVLLEISNYFNAYKVGFALSIDSDEIRTDAFYKGCTIKEWESKFWKKRLYYPNDNSLELYDAIIDTTFCLVNKNLAHKNFVEGFSIRVAGDFTCLHLPWFKNFKDFMLPGEYEVYLKNNISTSWFKAF